MKILILITLFITTAYAQTYPYRWQGTIDLSNTDTLNPIYPGPIAFTIEWNELNKEIRGLYRDNFLAGTTIVTGAVSASGRSMFVNFPMASQGVQSIELSSSESSGLNGLVPVSITVKGTDGKTTVRNISASMSSPTASTFCSLGFGVLAGYCGHYNGTAQETTDAFNHCNLTATSRIVVEMLPSTEVAVYSNGVRQPMGSLPLSPMNSHVLLSKRICGQFPNTNFDPTHCLDVRLEGDFVLQGDQKVFNGSYSIRDEKVGDNCSYTLVLDTLSP